MKLKIEIDLDNFEDGDEMAGAELVRIFTLLSDRVTPFCPEHYIPLRDINGNVVGSAEVTEEED